MSLQQLINQDLKSYQGLLIPDPNQPYCSFKVIRHFDYMKQETRLEHTGQRYQEHPDRVHDYVCSAAAEEPRLKNIFTKARTQPWTMQMLLDEAKKKEKPKPGTAASSAQGMNIDGDELSSNEAASEEDEGEAEGVTTGTAFTGPVLNAKKACESVVNVKLKRLRSSADLDDTASNGTAATAATAQSGRSPRVKKVNGIPVCDLEKAALVGRRIASCSIPAILEGRPLGRELRWCRETRDLFRDAQVDGLADKLGEHWVAGTAAETLASESVMDMPTGKLEVVKPDKRNII